MMTGVKSAVQGPWACWVTDGPVETEEIPAVSSDVVWPVRHGFRGYRYWRESLFGDPREGRDGIGTHEA